MFPVKCYQLFGAFALILLHFGIFLILETSDTTLMLIVFLLNWLIFKIMLNVYIIYLFGTKLILSIHDIKKQAIIIDDSGNVKASQLQSNLLSYHGIDISDHTPTRIKNSGDICQIPYIYGNLLRVKSSPISISFYTETSNYNPKPTQIHLNPKQIQYPNADLSIDLVHNKLSLITLITVLNVIKFYISITEIFYIASVFILYSFNITHSTYYIISGLRSFGIVCIVYGTYISFSFARKQYFNMCSCCHKCCYSYWKRITMCYIKRI